ncbi:type IV pilin N-terminal domain-containing protein [Methanomicrobium antiquum]|uniref:Type IV pilin N-terminal domain-containing protein n=1 Tax=Methanomicrobium antiquum TaxID=487686 RepID=A0AAF0FP83_9EURY|nr:type IV pilin N-terminal domain-containing protein [Methanomicrobium antiquum]WFN37923.1 type IV pilin N-terminal domain-containing protein [Methanomicrobium antiquum]
MRFTENEEAVSPVIGVILMVAITVILAAVIAVFVFGLAGDLETSAQKDVTVKTGTNADGNVTYTVFAGADVSKITAIEWTNGVGSEGDNSTDGPSGTPAVIIKVGAFGTTTAPKADGPVTFTAIFTDGSSQVVATTN